MTPAVLIVVIKAAHPNLTIVEPAVAGDVIRVSTVEQVVGPEAQLETSIERRRLTANPATVPPSRLRRAPIARTSTATIEATGLMGIVRGLVRSCCCNTLTANRGLAR